MTNKKTRDVEITPNQNYSILTNFNEEQAERVERVKNASGLPWTDYIDEASIMRENGQYDAMEHVINNVIELAEQMTPGSGKLLKIFKPYLKSPPQDGFMDRLEEHIQYIFTGRKNDTE